MELRMKKKKFRIISVHNKSRTGELDTAHGKIKTPVFMPVGTLANVKSVFPRDLQELGIQSLFYYYQAKCHRQKQV